MMQALSLPALVARFPMMPPPSAGLQSNGGAAPHGAARADRPISSRRRAIPRCPIGAGAAGGASASRLARPCRGRISAIAPGRSPCTC